MDPFQWEIAEIHTEIAQLKQELAQLKKQQQRSFENLDGKISDLSIKIDQSIRGFEMCYPQKDFDDDRD